MAGLQRFITYIYRYKNDEKMENAGFAKIEIRGGVCRMEVHIRNLNMEQTEASVYLFAEKENIIQGVPVGKITFAKGNGDIRYAFETKELGNFGMAMEDMEGIFIPLEDSLYLASRWKEGSIEQNRFRIMEKIQKQEETAQISEEVEAGKSEIKESNKTETNRQRMTGQNAARPEMPEQNAIRPGTAEQNEAGPEMTRQNAVRSEINKQNTVGPDMDKSEISSPEPTSPNKNAPEMKQTETNSTQPIQATELPLEEFFEEKGWEGIFQKLRLKMEIFFPFEGQEIECIRMQLNDLKEFPRKYWYIGNNSFLLHGFFNYRHIIFGKMEEKGEGRYFIGVPGVFMNQERVMAAMFGFPEFRTAKNTEYKTGNFGYWYRFI